MSGLSEESRFAVRVRPGARINCVVGFRGDVLELKIAAPPRKGRANAEMIAFLARVLGVGKSRIRVVRGERSSNKLVAVSGLDHGDLLQRLEGEIGGGTGN